MGTKMLRGLSLKSLRGGGPRQNFWEDQFQALGTTGAPNDRGNFW